MSMVKTNNIRQVVQNKMATSEMVPNKMMIQKTVQNIMEMDMLKIHIGCYFLICGTCLVLLTIRFTFPLKNLIVNRCNCEAFVFVVYTTMRYRIFFFFNCYLADPRPTLGHSQGDSLTNPMLITAF